LDSGSVRTGCKDTHHRFLIWQRLSVLTGQRVLRTASKQEKQKGVNIMPVYKIYRQYKIEAANPTQALRKLLDALDAKKDEDYHIAYSIREADEQPVNGLVTAWATSAKKQLFGK
jgi:hypothetical protein